MSRIVKFTISGHGADTDAPSVEDVLDQLRDYLDILRSVEEAAAGTAASAIVWRIVDAARRSPLTISVEPFPKRYGVNIDTRVNEVLTETARGLAILQYRSERPKYFTNDVMRRARKIFERVTNGIGMSGVDFGADLPKIHITPTSARDAARNVDLVLAPPSRPYQEIGSVEGVFQGVERDGYGRRVVHIKERVTGDLVKCIVTRNAKQGSLDLEQRKIADVWGNIRVEVLGRVFFESLGRIDHVEADLFRFFRSKSELPQIGDIIDEAFTDGLHSEEYLERLRDGTFPQEI
jgi:hypothetical protein